MADDKVVIESSPTEAEQVSDGKAPTESSAETTNTDKSVVQNEHMIPKSRFDQVNDELKSLRAAQEQADKEREQAELKQLEEQNNFKALYEKAQADAAKAAADLHQATVENIRNRVGAKLGVPDALISRIKGETEEEIEEDAKSVIEALPKPAAPNVGNQSGEGDAPAGGELTDVAKQELAAIYGVNPQYIQ